MSSVDSARCSLANARLILVYSFLYRVPQLATDSYFFPFSLVEELLQVRSHVGECELGAVCPEKAQQCSHAMLMGQPAWLAPLHG